MEISRQERSTRWSAAWTLALLSVPLLAQAHVGVGQTSGIFNGLTHPAAGFDHIAAMVAVGLWAAQLGGTAVWIVPLSFVTAMTMGGALGAAGISIPFVEPGIAASVLVLGLLIAAAVRLPLFISGVLVGLFAVFHGHAHGAEMPETVSGLAYGIGFVLATGLLHSGGIGLGLLARKRAGSHLVRLAGGITAAFGFCLLIG